MRTHAPNHFLASLAAEDLRALSPRLRPVRLPASSVLYNAGDELTHVYFPYSGMISVLVGFRNGASVAVGTVGSNGLIGGGFALGARHAINQAVVQVAITGAVVDARVFAQVAAQRECVREKLTRHLQIMFAQAQHIAACNAAHDIEARLCRWLAHTRDVLESDTLHLTQEFISHMLGVQRSSVTLAAQRLQDAGLIHYRRGEIHVIDPLALRRSACECYGALNEQFERLIGWKPRSVPPATAAIHEARRAGSSSLTASALQRSSVKRG